MPQTPTITLQRSSRISTPTVDGASAGTSNGTENYQLYRDTVITNRLTQRQRVNVPLMKATIRTLLSRAAEPADLEFEDYDNDGTRELLIKRDRRGSGLRFFHGCRPSRDRDKGIATRAKSVRSRQETIGDSKERDETLAGAGRQGTVQ